MLVGMADKQPRNNYWEPIKPERSFYLNVAILIARGAAVFAFFALVYVVYGHVLRQVFDTAGIIAAFVLLWLFTAYAVLPWVHRFLTGLYLPDYYIGRAKTSDGLLADPINLAILGDKRRLIAAMESSGWSLADPTTPKAVLKTLWYGVLRRAYTTAPVSNLFLFNKKQELAFQKEVPGKPHARHHVRFWSVPEGWKLPGGYQADWLGAATYDRRVGFSLFTGQVTHKIDEETDKERDFISGDLESAGARLKVVQHFNTAYHHRNGGGDSITTDGAMPFVYLPTLNNQIREPANS